MKNNTIQKNIWKLYLHEILRCMMFSVPILVLFWQENNLSMAQIMLLQSVFALLVVILEVPTGFFSDKYGRKSALILAGIFDVIAMLFLGFGTHFNHFLMCEVFFSLSISLASGTNSAMLYDTLKQIGRENEYKKIWGNIIFYSMIALAISNILGSIIAEPNFRYAIYASIPFFALKIPLVFSMQEPEKQKVIIQKGYIHELIEIGKKVFLQNHKLKWIIIYSGIIVGFNQSALWLYQPYFSLSGIDIVYFGMIFALFQIVAGISGKYAYKIEEKLGEKYSLIMLGILVVVSYFLMHNFIFLFSFSFCFLQQIVRGFKQTIISDYINKMVDSSHRATVLSIESLCGKFIYALIIPFFGWYMDTYGLKETLLIIGIMSGIVIMSILFILKNKKII